MTKKILNFFYYYYNFWLGLSVTKGGVWGVITNISQFY